MAEKKWGYTMKKITRLNRDELARRSEEDGDPMHIDEREEHGFEGFVSTTDAMDDCVETGEVIREHPPKSMDDES